MIGISVLVAPRESGLTYEPAAVTLTLCCTPATFSVITRGIALALAEPSSISRLAVSKLLISARRTYFPGATPVSVKRPSAFVIPLAAVLPTESRNETLAPAMALPVVSTTVPTTFALGFEFCADKGGSSIHKQPRNNNISLRQRNIGATKNRPFTSPPHLRRHASRRSNAQRRRHYYRRRRSNRFNP